MYTCRLRLCRSICSKQPWNLRRLEIWSSSPPGDSRLGTVRILHTVVVTIGALLLRIREAKPLDLPTFSAVSWSAIGCQPTVKVRSKLTRDLLDNAGSDNENKLIDQDSLDLYISLNHPTFPYGCAGSATIHSRLVTYF